MLRRHTTGSERRVTGRVFGRCRETSVVDRLGRGDPSNRSRSINIALPPFRFRKRTRSGPTVRFRGVIRRWFASSFASVVRGRLAQRRKYSRGVCPADGVVYRSRSIEIRGDRQSGERLGGRKLSVRIKFKRLRKALAIFVEFRVFINLTSRSHYYVAICNRVVTFDEIIFGYVSFFSFSHFQTALLKRRVFSLTSVTF